MKPTARNPSRENLEKRISEFAAAIPAGSLVLDAGSANGPYAAYFRHCRYETADLRGTVTHRCDLTAIPVEDSRFDFAICTQVIEHVRQPWKVALELHRVLKPGGQLLVTAPFFYEPHLLPHDFYRYTAQGLEHIFGEAGFTVSSIDWLEGYSCAAYHLLDSLERNLSGEGSRHSTEFIKRLSDLKEEFLEIELSDPVLEVGFPKNHVLSCRKPEPSESLPSRIRREGLTYLGLESLEGLLRLTDDAETRGIEGEFCEFGVALGGSAILLASRCRGKRRFFGFDVFGMIPPPGCGDDEASHRRYEQIASGKSSGIGGGEYYGYVADLLEVVKGNFRNHGIDPESEGICFIRGLYEHTLMDDALPRRVSLAHVDCDWYESVCKCLWFIARRMPIGGHIVIDDFNAWGGARKATLEFLLERADFDIVVSRPHAVLRRVKGRPDL